ncbi:ABC transporter substrate-binding protein [Microbacterium dextranolyticum]|uniref:ABC transporter substrate-binding protein n=1 Tax=Microbacterium dextranolyticum TaxID=36806 RepID=A0A9W6HPF6_9MICO|nr:ABC transporter substrate-binding protein [Microbacterium dextranolyticum]MBM7463678.1 peptide/nickel transport system substrate-binding protein [Microbacterium dextranolyticum]GLJ96491.1 ABC transporter substrate-binding protein [Microbacterium dextranolyticum]
MPRRVTLAAALVAVGALLLSACSAGTSPSPSDSSAGPADPNASVAVRLVSEPGNLDIRQTAGAALDQILIDNVYQGLVSRTPQQEIVDTLATKHTVSGDGLTYTFTLRDGVTFHDGQPLTPADVVWSLQQVKANAAYRDSDRLARVSSIAANGQDVVLTLSEPDSTLLWNLTGRAGLVLKEGDTIDRKTKANGTGPYTLASWKQGDSITLKRNESYWGDKAKAAEVVLDFIPDNQAALSGALAGELDVVTGFDATLKSQIEANGTFSLVLGASTDKGTLAMNATHGKLSDVRVRQAIRQAIDKKSIVQALGAGQTLYGPIPELDPGYEDLSSTAPFDPDAARKLLAEAGASDLTLTLTIPAFYGTTVSQILVSNLHDVGITLKVAQVEFPTWLKDVYTNKDYDLSFVLHTEARDFENWANPDYYFTYNNPKVQDLYAQSTRATDPATSADLLKQAAKIVADDQAADWLYNGASVVAVGTNVTGFPSINVNERMDLAQLAKS